MICSQYLIFSKPLKTSQRITLFIYAIGSIHFLKSGDYKAVYSVQLTVSPEFSINITFENNEKQRIAFQVLFTIMNESFSSNNDVDVMLSHQLEYISYFNPFSIFWNHNRAFVVIDVSEMTKVVDIGRQISIMKIHYQAMDLQIQTLPDYRTALFLSKGLDPAKVKYVLDYSVVGPRERGL